MKIAVLFDNLGPYHVARLAALSQRCDLLAIELCSTSATYAWDATARVPFRRTTLFEGAALARSKVAVAVRQAVRRALSDFGPERIVVPGWASKQAVSAVIWAGEQGVPVIVASDSQELDFPRSAPREWIKRRYLACCDAAIVAGRTHRKYLVKLGMNAARIRVGYDVVDNEYFSLGAESCRGDAAVLRRKHGLPERYFLSSARFVAKKNLARLIEAFSGFLEVMNGQNAAPESWHLVILGDGPLRGDLEQQVAALNMEDRVLMPGFKQYPDLPVYYGLAEAFVLPSTTEQWGLVINEAMASGLPVLVSERCGCASELVQADVNGYPFDPYDVGALTSLMLRLAQDEGLRRKMGRASTQTVGAWSPDAFAANLMELVETVQSPKKQRPAWLARPLLQLMLHRRSP